MEELSVAYREPIRRIAARVAALPTAGRYLAVGGSPTLRTQVEATLDALLGGGRVHRLDFSAETGNPWTLFGEKNAGKPLRGHLYCLHGLEKMAGPVHAYQQLNLARDAWGASGAQILIWLSGMAELDSFLKQAPDLWSHRDLLALFLCQEDFVSATVGGDEDRYGRELTLARQRWEDAPPGEEKVRAGLDLVGELQIARDRLEGWLVLEVCEKHRCLKKNPELARRCHRLRILLLLGLDRQREAYDRGQPLLVQAPRLPAWERAETALYVAASADFVPKEQLHLYQSLSHTPTVVLPEEGREVLFENAVRSLSRLGRLREARRWKTEGEAPEHAAWVALRESEIASATGDSIATLQAAEQARRSWLHIGRADAAGNATGYVEESLYHWGLPFEQPNPPGDHAETTRFLSVRVSRHWGMASPRTPVLLQQLLPSLQELALSYAGRGVAARCVELLMNDLDENILPRDPLLPSIQKFLQFLRGQSADDPMVKGWAGYLLARLSAIQGDFSAAFSATRDLQKWCKRWRGPVEEGLGLAFRARVAPDSPTGELLAANALKLVDDDLSIYAQITVRRQLSQLRQRLGGDAVTPLRQALERARAEELQPIVLQLLHDLSELPGYAGATEAAREARGLATQLLRPRDEARALLNLSVLSGQKHRWDRVTEVAEALGSPVFRARVAAAGSAL